VDSFTVATANTLTVDADGTIYELPILGVTIGQQNFSLSGDLTVTENAMCFCIGTHILAPHGEAAVENLRIGDLVVTKHDGVQSIKWIGQRSYDGRFIAGKHLMLPVCIKAGALASGIPARDLWVSPGHGIDVEGVLVPAWRLINGVSIVQPGHVSIVEYYHIELTSHNIIFAEGCAAESYHDDGQRMQFHNAASFAKLYPTAPASAGLVRTECGFVLQTIQRRLARRAGIAPQRIPTGPLRGYVDVAGPDIVAGWAQDENAPEDPVCLVIFRNGKRIKRVLANQFRADLRSAGLGSGCHAFEVKIPPGPAGYIELRRATDGWVLSRTEAAMSAG
jgi:hypothetical protein